VDARWDERRNNVRREKTREEWTDELGQSVLNFCKLTIALGVIVLVADWMADLPWARRTRRRKREGDD
jgi:hypothetical protein